MSRPPLEVADIVRCAGESFIKRSRKWISWQHQKVLLAISRCRTAALGGHHDQQLKPKRTDSNVNLANHQDQLIQIQTP